MNPFLLFRSSDQLVLGVTWTGMTVSAGEPGGSPPVLTATSDSAQIMVTFPPQHIAEETSTTPSANRQGVVSGPSRLAISIARNTVVALTAEGMLAALNGRPILASAAKPALDDTSLELPARLTIVPKALTSGTSVVCRHATTPRLADDVVGLWRTQLTASGPATDGRIGIQAVDHDPEDPPFTIPLASAARGRIVFETRSALARATRLELGALGGTLDVSGRWPDHDPTFEWEHHCVLGRDMKVRTLAKGALYPLGHNAELLQLTIRVFDPDAGGAAVLQTIWVLTVTEPVRAATSVDCIQRGFPFASVEITTLSFVDLPEPDFQNFPIDGSDVATYFWPETAPGVKVQFPLRCETANGEVHFALPMVFVEDIRTEDFASLTDPTLTAKLADFYGQTTVGLPGALLDLVGAAAPDGSGDIHEVHAITIGGVAVNPDTDDGYRAKVSGLSISMPALRSLLGSDDPRPMTFANDYLSGADSDVLLDIDANHVVDLDFTAQADRSGALIAPRYTANAISRSLGPVNLQAFPNPVTKVIDPTALFHPDAKILGFPMQDLLTDLKEAPKITCSYASGKGPDIAMTWTGIKLKTNNGGFVAGPSASLDLMVNSGPSDSGTLCTIQNFAFEFPPGDPVLRLTFASLSYTQQNGQPPTMQVGMVTAEFLGDLSLLENLKDVVDLGAAGKLIDITPTEITVHYSLAPKPASLSNGAFVLRNIALTARLSVPYDGRPVTLQLGFSSRANPFQMSVLMFGGTGYLEIELDKSGLRRFEAALEFGALVVVDFVVARGEVHVLGGVRFTLETDGSVTVTGYLRIGGSVEILGVVSVSIELILSLSYSSASNALVGRATIVVEVDLTLWSDSMEIDSGEWVLAGPHHHQLFALDNVGSPTFDGLSRWRTYRAAFDEHTDHALVS